MLEHISGIARASLAKVNSVSAGTTTTTDGRVSPMAQSLGITFDSNNNVLNNTTNANILDLQTRLTALENRLAQYENHTHSYTDATIADTTTGTGTTTTVTKTTGIVA